MSKPVTVWWSPGEDESDLHGFVYKKHRDDCGAGEPGPFLRIVRDHHTLGPVPFETKLIRVLYSKPRPAPLA